MSRLRRTFFALGPLTALASSLLLVDLPLYSLAPGDAREVVPLVEVRGLRTYEPRGRLLLTTISIGRLTPVEAVAALLEGDREILPERDVLDRGETDRDYRRASRSQMDRSKISAAAYAFRRLTPYPERHGPGALIYGVVSGSPADGRLAPGDRIVRAGNRPIAGLEDLDAALDAAGERPIRLELMVDGESETVTVRRRRPKEGGEPMLGISVIEAFPYGVSIESEDTGGPSAGLMYSLALVDLLTPGSLTSGRTIAGTGAVDLEGEVSPVGGVMLKVLAAERAGAEIFLVPSDNLEEARAARPEMRLVAVDTVDEAIAALERGAP